MLLGVVLFFTALFLIADVAAYNILKPSSRLISRICSTPATDGLPPSGIKARLAKDMKDAMKAKEKEKLAAIRAIQTAIKQKEVDDRVVVDDEAAILIMSKLVKQRKESIKSYLDGGRTDLAEAETKECEVIVSYMPSQLTPEEIQAVIAESIRLNNATTVKDMGKVMADVRPKLSGKADLSQVGEMVKKLLSPPK